MQAPVTVYTMHHSRNSGFEGSGQVLFDLGSSWPSFLYLDSLSEAGGQRYKQAHKEDDSHLGGILEKMKVQWMESDGDSPGRPMLPSGGEAPRIQLRFRFEMYPPKNPCWRHGPLAAVLSGAVFER